MPEENLELKLNLEDYKRILSIINVAAQKGVFSGSELYYSGLTYEKIKKHILERESKNETKKE